MEPRQRITIKRPLPVFAITTGIIFLSLSLTPSLIPRNFITQGVLSGFAFVSGYLVAVIARKILSFLEVPIAGFFHSRWLHIAVLAAAIAFTAWCLYHSVQWQNSIRDLMGMDDVASIFGLRVLVIAAAVSALSLSIIHVLSMAVEVSAKWLNSTLPARVSYLVSVILVIWTAYMVFSGVLAKQSLKVADAFFTELDELIDEGIEQPLEAHKTGSEYSLIPWDSIGRRGKEFITEGPGPTALSQFAREEAQDPLRVYVGIRSRETLEERARLALEELKRIDAFSRSILVVATPTGTGWLDPGAVDTLEYLHRGDTAIVSIQYSYLPSWLTILVDPTVSQSAARVLFDTVYAYWRSLPVDQRPKLFLHGLSLGALGSETTADLVTLFDDPIDGALWSGPPFPSQRWRYLTQARNPGSPAWLPEFRDGSLIRFAAQNSDTISIDQSWGSMRLMYLQYASDPMVFFEPEILVRSPAWLREQRGPDVSPYLQWYPVITFLQIAFDLPLSTSVPSGFGHNYSSSDYIEAWHTITEASGWTRQDIERLKAQLAL